MGLHPAGAELPINWPGSDSEDSEFDDVPAGSIYKLVPSMQPYRNNLTALSQKCNVGVHQFSSSFSHLCALTNDSFGADHVRSPSFLF